MTIPSSTGAQLYYSTVPGIVLACEYKFSIHPSNGSSHTHHKTTMTECYEQDTINNPDSLDGSCTDDEDGPEITAMNGLSLDVLQMLQRFQNDGCFLEDDEDDTKIPQGAVCATYTAHDSQVIAATCRRLQEKAELAAKNHQQVLEQRVMIDLVAPDLGSQQDTSQALAQVLSDEGVVRVNQVLAPDLCDRLLSTINEALAASDYNAADAECDGFGNVFARNLRYDMYLHPEGVYKEALHAMLSRDSTLGGLLHGLLHGQPGVFHEFSSLISDPGSDCQPIHPDSPYAPQAQMWTVFVALQDIDATMGPTVFLRGTQTLDCHEQLKSLEHKDAMLASCQYQRATIQKGDATIMDSRTMHFGGANESETRRVVRSYRSVCWFHTLLRIVVGEQACGSTRTICAGCHSLSPARSISHAGSTIWTFCPCVLIISRSAFLVCLFSLDTF
jgi:Phytanoyl-CoA dioxygenase (PhyH)